MRSLRVFLWTIALLLWPIAPAQAQQPASEPPAAQAAPGDTCKAYYAIQPLDPKVLQLLGPATAPANRGPFVNPDWQQLQDWNFPPKVTSWDQRPSTEELARRREELTKPPNDNKSKSPIAVATIDSRPYELEPLPDKAWKDLEKWFAKEAPKKISGACVNREKATFVLAIGVITTGSPDRSLQNSASRNEYNQLSGAHRQDSSIGPNAATTSVPHETSAQELSGMGSSGNSSRPGAYTCAYLYRTRDGQGGNLRQAPDQYYCKADSVMPRAVIGTMLKYLTQQGQP